MNGRISVPHRTKTRTEMPQLAQRMSRAKPSAIMVIADNAKRLKAEGRDIISFSIGVPNFLPGEHVYAAAREALQHDSGQYGSNRGPDALLEARKSGGEGKSESVRVAIGGRGIIKKTK